MSAIIGPMPLETQVEHLRAQLAAVTKGRDALRACYVSEEALMLHGMTMEQAVEWRHKARILEGERDAALARVAKLEESQRDLEICMKFATNDAVRSAANRVFCSKCYDAVLRVLDGEEG